MAPAHRHRVVTAELGTAVAVVEHDRLQGGQCEARCAETVGAVEALGDHLQPELGPESESRARVVDVRVAGQRRGGVGVGGVVVGVGHVVVPGQTWFLAGTVDARFDRVGVAARVARRGRSVQGAADVGGVHRAALQLGVGDVRDERGVGEVGCAAGVDGGRVVPGNPLVGLLCGPELADALRHVHRQPLVHRADVVGVGVVDAVGRR